MNADEIARLDPRVHRSSIARAVRQRKEETSHLADAPTGALLRQWEKVAAIPALRAEVAFLINAHVVADAVFRAPNSSRERESSQRLLKARRKKLENAVNAISEVILAEAASPLRARLSPTLSHEDLRTVATAAQHALEPLLASIKWRDAVAAKAKKSRSAGPRDHPSWARLVQRLAAIHACAYGASPSDGVFLKGLQAMNANLPTSLSSDALRKRISRSLKSVGGTDTFRGK